MLPPMVLLEFFCNLSNLFDSFVGLVGDKLMITFELFERKTGANKYKKSHCGATTF